MSNWQIIDGNCRCVQPNFVLVRNGTTECHVSPKLLLISAKYLQLGNQISIMLDYNHAKE